MTKIISRLVRNTGRGLALQEALYGFIMAMLFVTAASFGLIKVSSNGQMIMLIIGMDFSWGLIDMIIFYFIDRAEQRKYVRILKGEDLYDEKKKVIRDNLSGTIVDVLDEESEERIVDIIAEGMPEERGEYVTERRGIFKSAFSCFIITIMAAIPSVVSLLLVSDLQAALLTAGVSSSVCMFFIGFKMGPYFGTKGWISGTFVLALALGITLAATFTGG